jgi:hypothetical protein
VGDNSLYWWAWAGEYNSGWCGVCNITFTFYYRGTAMILHGSLDLIHNLSVPVRTSTRKHESSCIDVVIHCWGGDLT